ncbi:MAG TPA: prolipoprotein diacylglyceryl transferase, partial [Smithellaceae bacterium]|nr:prolipoprotein diacylglyceryl transferase [Smithellaceae bacterium]
MTSFFNFWQNLPAQISPDLFTVGSFQLRYYSLMYIVAFALIYLIVLYRIKHENYEFKSEIIQDYMVWAMVGVIVGARIGYALFYNFHYY